MVVDQEQQTAAVEPWAFIVLGVIVGALGFGFLDTQPALGVVSIVAGAGMLVFGVIAEAVRFGIRSSRRGQ